MTATEIMITLAIAGGLAAIFIYILKRRKPVKSIRSTPLYQQTIGRTTRPHWPRDTEAVGLRPVGIVDRLIRGARWTLRAAIPVAVAIPGVDHRSK